MEVDSSKISVALSLGWTGVVDATFPKLVSWHYNFVVADNQTRWTTSSGVRDMRGVR